MSSNKTHNRIAELIQLIEINHNRMVLNESSFDLDIAQMRSHVLELYTCLDQLILAKSKETPKKEEKEETEKVEKRENIQRITIDAPLTTYDAVPEMPNISVPEIPFVPEKDPIKTPRFQLEPIEENPAPIEIPAIPTKPEIEIPDETQSPEIEIEEIEEVEQVEVPEPIIPEPIKPEPSKPEPVEEVPTLVAPKIETPKIEKANPPARPEKKPLPEGDVFDQLRKKKLDSIKKGISIGKRYEIQNALFENDAEAYNHAIEQLDNSEDLNNASHLLSAYAKRYDWDPESALVDELFLLLQRRYID